MTDKILGLLGLMRKAGAVEIGMEHSEDALRKGKAKLVILPEDASDRIRKNIGILAEGRNAVSIDVPCSGARLGAAVGVGECAALTVTDLGFADALAGALAESSPEKYGAAAERIRARLEKVKRRKVEKPGKKVKK